jgi:hypothetical protein
MSEKTIEIGKSKMFYPNMECLKYVETAVSELEIVIKYPTRILEHSPFAKYRAVLDKGNCDDFLSVCVENPDKIRNTLWRQWMLMLCYPWDDRIEQARLRKRKKELHDRCNLILLELKTQLKLEKAQDRKELLILSCLFTERIIYELKSDLMA